MYTIITTRIMTRIIRNAIVQPWNGFIIVGGGGGWGFSFLLSLFFFLLNSGGGGGGLTFLENTIVTYRSPWAREHDVSKSKRFIIYSIFFVDLSDRVETVVRRTRARKFNHLNVYGFVCVSFV